MSNPPEDMTAMSHEADGGRCWCGPKCEPIQWAPVSPVVEGDNQ